MLFRTPLKNPVCQLVLVLHTVLNMVKLMILKWVFYLTEIFLENQNIIKSVWIDTMPTMTQMMMAL